MAKAKRISSTTKRDLYSAPPDPAPNQSSDSLNEAWFRTTLYSIGDAVITTNTLGQILQMNPVAEKLTGWSEADAQGKDIQSVFHILNEETRQEIPNPVERVLREGTVIGLANHTILVARDGTEYPITDSGAPIRNLQGEIVGVVLVFRDQSAERKAQAEINRARKFSAGIVETIRQPLLVLDAELRVISANKAFYTLFQVQETETLGKYIYDLGNRQWDIPALRELLEKILPQNTKFEDFLVKWKFEHIGERTMLLNARRIYQEGGKTETILLAIEDITQRKKAEDALQTNEKNYRLLFENNPLPMWVYDLETLQFLMVNDAALNQYGYNRNEFLAMTIKDIRPEEDIPALMEDVAQTTADLNFAGEWRHRRKNGEIFPVEIISHVIDYHGHAARLVVAIDLTERKRIENALRESQDKFRRLTENATDLIYRYDFLPEAKFTYVSPAATQITGFTPEEHYADPQLGLKLVHPDDRPKLEAYFQGSGSFYQPIEFRWVRKDGRIIWTEQRNVPIYDRQGNLIAIEGIARDITERKRRELELEALAMVSRAIGRSWQLQPLLEEIIHAALHAIPSAEKGSLALLSDATHLTVMAQRGYADTAVLGFTYPISWGYAGRAFQEQKPMIIPDVLADPTLRQNGASAELEEVRQLRSAVVVPLVTSQGAIGVVSLESTKAEAFNDIDLQILNSLATPLALIIQNARLQEQVHQRLHLLESLHEISSKLRIAQSWQEALPIIMDEILTFFKTSNAVITLNQPDKPQKKIEIRRGYFLTFPEDAFSIERVIAHLVFQNQKVYAIPDFRAEKLLEADLLQYFPPNHSGACVPILSSEQVLGMLWIALEGKHRLSDEDILLLEALGEMVGTTLQRLRLHEEALQRISQLQALQAVDKVIAASLDIQLMLEILVQQAFSQLKADALGILLFNPHTHTLDYTAGWGLYSPKYKRTHLSLGEGFAGQTVLKRETLLIPDLKKSDSKFAKEILDQGFRSYIAVPLSAKGFIKGVMEIFHYMPFEPDSEWINFLEMLAGQAAIAIDNAQMYSELQQSNLRLSMAYDATIAGWTEALELRDRETKGHTMRVTELTLALAEAYGVNQNLLPHIRRGAILHDIGKMAISDQILNKPGPLSTEEWALMQQHPQIAYDLLRKIDYLKPALDIPYCHHEHWDGSGYPRGLKGEEIPLAARLFAVVDVWDALISDRPYRKAWKKEDALDYIRQQAGKQFDPRVVDIFLKIISKEI
ncbi:MAG: PAS domain S-box protein [Anaerolineales bacterium]